jgi:large subunit ribosomal protein L24
MESMKPSKQRKEFFHAPLHKKRKWISAHLEEKLLLKYDKRAVPVVKGDTVRLMRGSFKGHEDKIVNVNVKKRNVEIEGITMTKANGNKIAKPVHPSNVLIIKLNLTDKWRRKQLERGLSEDTKKEIEEEAKEQIKLAEEERRKEEAKAIEEEKVTEEEEEPKDIEEKPEKKQEEKKPKDEVKKKPTPKEKTKKDDLNQKTKTVKKTPTKKPSEKKITKKTPAKTAKKKEENK